MATLVTQEKHRSLLGYFTAKDRSVWSALAAKRIAEAQRPADATVHRAVPSQSPPVWAFLDRENRVLPNTVSIPVQCPACSQEVSVPYAKEFGEILDDTEDGTTFRIAYRLASFECTECPLTLPDTRYCAAASLPVSLNSPPFDELKEFVANAYAYWGWAEDDGHYHDSDEGDDDLDDGGGFVFDY